MSKIKKIICLLLSVIMVLSLNVPVFANDNTQNAINSLSTTEITENLQITVSTDNYSYNASSVATIYVSVKNVSDETLKNVKAQAVFDDLQPVSARKSTTSLEIAELKAGESFDFSYKATLNINKHDLNIFQKIFLWIVRLFNGGYTATNNSIDVIDENTTDIIFGKFTAKNVIQVGYENNGSEIDEPFTFTEEELTTMEIVNNKITELTHADEFNEYSLSKRKSKIENILDELVENDLIVEDSIVFDDEYNQFYFEYDTGIGYYIDIDEYEDHAGENATLTEDTQLFNLTRNVANKLSNNSDSLGNNAVYIYGANNTDYNTVKTDVEQLNKLGIKTDLYTFITVENYKTILLSYDVITIVEHGYEFLDDNKLALSLSEKATTEKNKSIYADDLDKKRIIIKNGYYGITPEFFSHYYKDQLNGTFVNLVSCQSMGRNGRENHKFSEAFAQCGASAVLGFHNDVNYRYGLDFSQYYTMQLFFSKTSKEAFEISKEQIGKNFVEFVNKNLDNATDAIKKEAEKAENNGTICYPIITSHYANPFDFGTVTITVKDKFTSEPAKNVSGKIFWIEDTAELYSNNPNSHFEYTIVFDETGVLSDKLAIGYYGCIFNDDAYETEYITFSIEKDTETVLVEPVYLTPKTYLMGTVIDKETNNPVEDASVLLQKIDEAGMIVGEYTCSTNKDGKFEISVPVGNYTYTINKLDMLNELYENATGTVTVSNVTGNVLATVYLSPKNSSGETERTVIDSGNCGADGDNVTWTLYEDGELVISGSGAMENYKSGDWYDRWSTSPFGDTTAKTITIKEGVTSIGDYAFYFSMYDSYITEVTIPNSVTYIGDYAFRGCSNLEKINIPNSVTSIGKSAFRGCSNLANINIPNGVTEIKEQTFYNCSNLTEIIIPDSVTTIEYMSFINCTNLKSVKFGSRLEIIGTQAFQSCEKLSEIILPDSLKEIGSSAFARCYCLEYAQIGDKVTNIGGSAFYNCSNIESISIPSSVQTIGENAFENCTNLNNVYITDIAKWCQIVFANTLSNPLYYADNLYLNGTLVENEIELPSNTSTINNYAFYRYNNLTTIIIPDSVTTIGEDSFYYCENLVNLVIGDGVTEIGDYAFNGCPLEKVIMGNGLNAIPNTLIGNTLKEFVIGNGVQTIEESTFYYCKYLTCVTIGENVQTIGNQAFYNCSALTSIYIPDSVTTIGESAFRDCTSIKNVTMGENVHTIDNNAFYCCYALESITIPDSTVTIGDYAFYVCRNLTNVTLGKNIETIGDYAFCACKITDIIIPSSIIEFGEHAFSECTNLTSVIIEKGVQTIGNFAFYRCPNVTSIVIEEGVETIGDYAFVECKITNIVIPSTVTTIGYRSFSSCSNLVSISIPNSVTVIDDYAFHVCYNLKDVYYSGTQEEWESITIGDYNEGLTDATIHYNS